ncbi:MAG: hypothetical protein ACI4NA_02840 [Succinivibrio sp.]
MPGIFIDPSMKGQLKAVFSRMERPIVLEVQGASAPRGDELLAAMGELCSLSNKLTLEASGGGECLPCVRILDEGGSWTGISFHGIPGGHEFTPFVLAIYNASGPGQKVDPAVLERIRAISRPVRIRILVSLECTACPELVITAQRIASLNPIVSCEAYDAALFASLAREFGAKAVPAMKAGDQPVEFGAMPIDKVLSIIERA